MIRPFSLLEAGGSAVCRLGMGLLLVASLVAGCAGGEPEPGDDAAIPDGGVSDATMDADVGDASDGGDETDASIGDAATDGNVDEDGGDDAGTEGDAGDDGGIGLGDCLFLHRDLPDEPARFLPIGPEVTGPLLASSSPRAFDVDRDGCVDFVFGTGMEFDSGRVSAVSGASGERLWMTTTVGEVFGSPVFRELPSGRTQVVIGGREGTLVSLEGETGDPMWIADVEEFEVRDFPFNFYSAQWIEDVNDDGAADLLVVYGGDALAGPGEPRDPSWVGILDGITGHVLARRHTPDLRESYSSPTIYKTADESPSTGSIFVFGTGGETLPGAVFMGTVAELLEPTTDESWGTELVSSAGGKGVIAPVTIVDLNADGELDVVVAEFGGRVRVLHGPLFVEAWHVDFEGEETYGTPVPVRMADGSYALAFTHNVGVFPFYTGTVHRVLRASDGALLMRVDSTVGGFSSSPLAVDLDGDGNDEVIVGTTYVLAPPLMAEIQILDVARETAETYELPFAMGVTPLVHVAEGSDQLELVFVGFDRPSGEPPSYRFQRVALGARAPAHITWGGYMGNCGTGRADCPAP